MTVVTNLPSSTHLLPPVERKKIKRKYLKLITYKLPNGETAITVRQMALSVRNKPQIAKKFLKKMGIRPITVQLPNHRIADMVSLSTVAAFWEYLEESGQGNSFTKLGREMLVDIFNCQES